MNIEPIGKVRKLSDGEFVLEIAPAYKDGLHGIEAGDRLRILYWMHELPDGGRRALRVHPQGDRSRPLKGVFALHSPMRPNPIGVTVVSVTRIEGTRISVRGLDARDGSPVIDIKGA